MAPATTFSYHVAGPIVPQLNIGSENAFVALGECEDGADLRITPVVHEIKHDGGGGPDGLATDDIFLNAEVEISFNIVPFAGTYLNKLRAMSIASASDGVMVTPGTLYGESSMYPALYLPVSATWEIDGPWLFRIVRVVDPGSNRVSVKESKPRMVFVTRNYFAVASATSIVGLTPWARTAPP